MVYPCGIALSVQVNSTDTDRALNFPDTNYRPVQHQAIL